MIAVNLADLASLLMFAMVWSLPFAVLCALAAPSRNRARGPWFLAGLVFGLFGFIAILVMGRKPQAA